MRRAAPRSFEAALTATARALAPASTLARAQAAWEHAAGPVVAAEAQPVAERDGVLTVSCSSASWAHELSLLAGEIVPRLNAEIGPSGGAPSVRELRFTAARPAARGTGRRR